MGHATHLDRAVHAVGIVHHHTFGESERRIIDVPVLAAGHSRRMVYASFVFLAGGASIGIITAVAYWSGHPLVVPSLGPTAFLIFNRSQSRVARPRNAILGHLLGAIAGYVALVVFGLEHAPSVVTGGLTAPRIGAAALSIAITSGGMVLGRVEHGPAGATTLIVSLGFMTTPASVAILMAGVLGLVACGVAIDHLVGLQVPYWSTRPVPRSDGNRAAVRGQRSVHPDESRERPPQAWVPRDANRSASDTDTRTDPGTRWVVMPDEGRRVLSGPEGCRIKVDGSSTGGCYALLEVSLHPDHPADLLHVHYRFAETYIVVEGEVAAEIGADHVLAHPGDVICVPAGVSHVLSCAGRTACRCMCITEPAGQSEPEFLP